MASMTDDDLTELEDLERTLLARGARSDAFHIEGVTRSGPMPRHVLRRVDADWVVEDGATRVYAGPDVAAAARAMFSAMRDGLTPPGTEHDMHPVVVGGLRNYFWGVLGEVECAAVRWDGEIVGYLWAGVAAAENGAGWADGMRSDPDRRGDYWYERLRELWTQDVPALAALDALLGEAGPERAGTVDREAVRAPSKMELDERLNPAVAERRREHEAAMRERGRGRA
jgi:hypothetical protein